MHRALLDRERNKVEVVLDGIIGSLFHESMSLNKDVNIRDVMPLFQKILAEDLAT